MPSRRTLTAAALAALAGAGAASGAAEAASVGRVTADFYGRPLLLYTYAAAPGEANRLAVTQDARGYVFRDAGAPLRARAGCRRLDARSVRCPVPRGPIITLNLLLGDRDDRLSFPGPVERAGQEVDVYVLAGGGADTVSAPPSGGDYRRYGGGPGADVLRAGSGGAVLDGGPGRDVLLGGSGDDELDGDADLGAPGSDGIAPLRPARRGERDVLDGGGGIDRVVYQRRPQRILVDLRRGRGGAAGEGDRLRAIEDATGGAVGSVLRGDDGPNRLAGSRDADVRDLLVGGGGDDLLDGTTEDDERAPRDVLLGGPGADRLVRPGAGSFCGSGRDVTRTGLAFSFALAPPGCELQKRFSAPDEPFALDLTGTRAIRGGAARAAVEVVRPGRTWVRVLVRRLADDQEGVVVADGRTVVAAGTGPRRATLALRPRPGRRVVRGQRYDVTVEVGAGPRLPSDIALWSQTFRVRMR